MDSSLHSHPPDNSDMKPSFRRPSNDTANRKYHHHSPISGSRSSSSDVNRNIVGSGYMSTDQKKNLLCGNKKTTAAEESGSHWGGMPLFSDRERQEKFNKLMSVKGDLKLEQKPTDKDGSSLFLAEKQEQLQQDLEKQYTAGLRRRDGRTVGLGL